MLELIKKIREQTGAGMVDIKKALEEANGIEEDALKILKEKGIAKAAKKVDRETSEGTIGFYLHGDGKSAAMVKLLCETDFVAKNEEFQQLAKDLAMQVTAMKPTDAEELNGQAFVKDPETTVEEVIKEKIGKIGENIKVEEIVRVEL